MNIFDAIKKHHNKHPECEYDPVNKGKPTQYAAGTPQKVEEMRQRLLRGEDLFHEDDKKGYDGCEPGCVKGSVELPSEQREGRRTTSLNLTHLKESRHWWEEL